ncbi:MAG: M23 family metallopeptidase [Spirochaetaceae bacterium]|nr:M23 family metallopeptidase [Spirochaetaceae bacterium]
MAINFTSPTRKKNSYLTFVGKAKNKNAKKPLMAIFMTFISLAAIIAVAVNLIISSLILPEELGAYSFTFAPPAVFEILEQNNIQPRLSGMEFNLTSGEVLFNAINNRIDDRSGVNSAIAALQGAVNLRLLQVGQPVIISYVDGISSDTLHSVIIPLRNSNRVTALRQPDGSFKVSETVNLTLTQPTLKQGVVRTSLYQAGLEVGIPANRLAQIFDIFAFSVDFQRDIFAGDELAVIYEELVDTRGNVVGTGNLLAVKLTTRGQPRQAYSFDGDFFDENGESIRRALLLTPVQGGRLTSSFGTRRNPISGFTEHHPALDFAAPMGTPIMSAGDGVVVHRGWDARGYGNYVVVRHNNSYETLYAHMSRFNNLAPVGARVAQGQTIGYIGSTGQSTGPHVHYEIRRNGVRLNPAVAVANMPSGRSLTAGERPVFIEHIHDLAAQLNP